MNGRYGLTMDAMLGDPLIQLMMRSDGVSQQEHAELLHRVRDTLIARHGVATAPYEPISAR